MTKSELWAIYIRSNPSFGDPDAIVKMSARGLKKLFDQTWDKGFASGEKAEKALNNLNNLNKKGGNLDYFKDIFGMKD